jgi:hypothetical protein
VKLWRKNKNANATIHSTYFPQRRFSPNFTRNYPHRFDRARGMTFQSEDKENGDLPRPQEQLFPSKRSRSFPKKRKKMLNTLITAVPPFLS